MDIDMDSDLHAMLAALASSETLDIEAHFNGSCSGGPMSPMSLAPPPLPEEPSMPDATHAMMQYLAQVNEQLSTISGKVDSLCERKELPLSPISQGIRQYMRFIYEFGFDRSFCLAAPLLLARSTSPGQFSTVTVAGDDVYKAVDPGFVYIAVNHRMAISLFQVVFPVHAAFLRGWSSFDTTSLDLLEDRVDSSKFSVGFYEQLQVTLPYIPVLDIRVQRKQFAFWRAMDFLRIVHSVKPLVSPDLTAYSALSKGAPFYTAFPYSFNKRLGGMPRVYTEAEADLADPEFVRFGVPASKELCSLRTLSDPAWALVACDRLTLHLPNLEKTDIPSMLHYQNGLLDMIPVSNSWTEVHRALFPDIPYIPLMKRKLNAKEKEIAQTARSPIFVHIRKRKK